MSHHIYEKLNRIRFNRNINYDFIYTGWCRVFTRIAQTKKLNK